MRHDLPVHGHNWYLYLGPVVLSVASAEPTYASHVCDTLPKPPYSLLLSSRILPNPEPRKPRAENGLETQDAGFLTALRFSKALDCESQVIIKAPILRRRKPFLQGTAGAEQ